MQSVSYSGSASWIDGRLGLNLLEQGNGFQAFTVHVGLCEIHGQYAWIFKRANVISLGGKKLVIVEAKKFPQ